MNVGLCTCGNIALLRLTRAPPRLRCQISVGIVGSAPGKMTEDLLNHRMQQVWPQGFGLLLCCHLRCGFGWLRFMGALLLLWCALPPARDQGILSAHGRNQTIQTQMKSWAVSS
jgi:hypothetical protein